MEAKTHYQINVCGGDFEHVKDCFKAWKEQTLIYRKDQHMFEGKNEVRPLSDLTFDNGERARHALEQTCKPQDSYALAAEVDDGERGIWLVMAAYQERRGRAAAKTRTVPGFCGGATMNLWMR